MRDTLVLLITICFVSSGCATYSGRARHRFSWDNTCPEERVTATERTDLVPHELLHQQEPDPSPDIASDPERLALWHQRWGQAFAYEDQTYSVFEVTGCGRTQVFMCKTALRGAGRWQTRYVDCRSTN